MPLTSVGLSARSLIGSVSRQPSFQRGESALEHTREGENVTSSASVPIASLVSAQYVINGASVCCWLLEKAHIRFSDHCRNILA